MRFYSPTLELKVPPVALVLVLAIMMWMTATYTPSLGLALTWRRAMAGTLIGLGILLSIAGVAAFRRARTTVNPTQPERTSTMVTEGVYRFSRNPMYLGFLFVLAGWAALLSHILAFGFLAVYVVYMDRYQIAPEERVLAAKFGEDYADYRRSVRRWA